MFVIFDKLNISIRVSACLENRRVGLFCKYWNVCYLGSKNMYLERVLRQLSIRVGAGSFTTRTNTN